ncbi:hypothetical protein KKI23_00515, partial [Patescibacteria group bacterium]|nr:hypothetical protein [Patescibacteria group bacterium]
LGILCGITCSVLIKVRDPIFDQLQAFFFYLNLLVLAWWLVVTIRTNYFWRQIMAGYQGEEEYRFIQAGHDYLNGFTVRYLEVMMLLILQFLMIFIPPAS